MRQSLKMLSFVHMFILYHRLLNDGSQGKAHHMTIIRDSFRANLLKIIKLLFLLRHLYAFCIYKLVMPKRILFLCSSELIKMNIILLIHKI